MQKKPDNCEELIKNDNLFRVAKPCRGHLVHAKEIITNNNLLKGEHKFLENKDSSSLYNNIIDKYYTNAYILYRTSESGEYYIIYLSQMICGKMTKTEDGEYILVKSN
jgi:hypothetical protein